MPVNPGILMAIDKGRRSKPLKCVLTKRMSGHPAKTFGL